MRADAGAQERFERGSRVKVVSSGDPNHPTEGVCFVVTLADSHWESCVWTLLIEDASSLSFSVKDAGVREGGPE
jgi:hypothetical protein